MSRSSRLVALPLLALLAHLGLAGLSTGAQRESRESDLARLNAPETATATERGESLVGRVETIVVDGGHMTASSVRVLGKSQSPPSCAVAGQQQIAVLLVTLPGAPAPSVAKTDVADAFFGASGSLDSWLREVSYGKTSATGDVFG